MFLFVLLVLSESQFKMKYPFYYARLSTIKNVQSGLDEIGSFGLSSQYEGGNLAASKIRNLECPSYEICLIDYGCGKFNRKIHIMEQYP